MPDQRLPNAPYPDADDALADQPRSNPTTGTRPPPPPAVPGAATTVRPDLDGSANDDGATSPAEHPGTAAARDPDEA